MSVFPSTRRVSKWRWPMCKLLIGVQTAPNHAMSKLIALQEAQLVREPHGISSYVNAAAGTQVFRSLKDYAGVLAQTYEQIDQCRERPFIVSLHTRTASTGTVSEENVHFFEYDGYLLAHNGFVSAYGAYGSYRQTGFGWKELTPDDEPSEETKAEKELSELYDKLEDCEECCKHKGDLSCPRHQSIANRIMKLEVATQNALGVAGEATAQIVLSKPAVIPKADPSDSLQFLINLPKPATAESIRAEVNAKGMSGVALLIDKAAKIGYLIASREVILHTDWKTYSLFYSYEPESVIPLFKRLPKLPIIVPLPHKGKKFAKHSLPAGIYQIPLIS